MELNANSLKNYHWPLLLVISMKRHGSQIMAYRTSTLSMYFEKNRDDRSDTNF